MLHDDILHNDILHNGERYFELNGVRHWVRLAGADHRTLPLVILHGGPGGMVHTFEQTAGLSLTASQTVVYYEQRGCGRSGDAPNAETYTLPWLIADLEALRQQLQLERLNLLGFSFGAELALEYAAAHPERVDRIVAHAPASIFGSRIAAVQLRGFELVANAELRAQIQRIVAQHSDLNEALERVWEVADTKTVDRFLFQNPEAASRNRASWLEFNTRFNPSSAMARGFRWLPRDPNRALEILPGVAAPTLVLTGLFDRNGGVDLNRDAAALLPNSRFQIFSRSAHFPDIEETEAYVKTVLDFLNL